MAAQSVEAEVLVIVNERGDWIVGPACDLRRMRKHLMAVSPGWTRSEQTFKLTVEVPVPQIETIGVGELILA